MVLVGFVPPKLSLNTITFEVLEPEQIAKVFTPLITCKAWEPSTDGKIFVKFITETFWTADVAVHPFWVVAVTDTLYKPPLLKIKDGEFVVRPVLLLEGETVQT